METRWRIELLGGLRATQGDQEISRFRSQKTGVLLAYLACHGHRTHPREALIELLWPEGEPHSGRQLLSTALSSLRHQFEPPGIPAGAVLIADRASVRLNPGAITTDVAEFQAALQAAKHAGSGVEQTAFLAQAVELYPGELLPGYFEDWVLQEREWLAQRYVEALGQLLAHLERASEFDRALDYARRGVSADPLREEAHRDLIRLLGAVGQPAAALRQYQELERLLKEQLEATPEAATRSLVREIERLALLRQAPAAAARLPGSRGASSTAERSPIGEGETRLVTLLFADMSRSLETTRDLHPEDAAALVNRLLQAIVDVVLKYEGRIDRFQGDGALAVFGVPQAHEDDPERAIRAALEIREAARHLGLEVTAGINTGEVYVGAVGTERHQEMTVMGPAVGLAARLQEQAQTGQILVGEVTQRLTRRAFESAPLSLGLKGLAQPVVVYTVEQALPRPEKARGIEGLRAELIGRDEELARMKAALAAVMQGRGQVVTLIGEAGVGKSRLVTELKLAALAVPNAECRVPSESRSFPHPAPGTRHPAPPLWLEGRCLELTMTAGYSLFVDLFRDYFAWRPEEDDRARGERLAACLRELMGPGELAEDRLGEMGPLLGHLFSVRFGTDWDDRLKNAGPEQIRHQTFLAVRDFLVLLARRQPVVLILEDLHWADSSSLDLILLLMETLAQAPILLLCVYRPEREHKCWHLGTIAARKCPERYTDILLRELTPEQSARLVESLLNIDNLPAAVKERILEKSRGNPFFVEEVVRSLIAGGRVYREGKVWRAQEGIETIRVPESIQSVILSRVDRLRPELKQVLQSASVMGRLFRRRLLEQTVVREESRRTSREFEQALWELEEQELIYQERAVPEEEYSFKHVLTQETIYESILRRHRAVLHQQVAETMEALHHEGLDEYTEQLAYHYERSHAEEKAVEYLLKAGEKSLRAYLNEEAIGYFQRALARLDGAPSRDRSLRQSSRARLEALKGLGQTYAGMGRKLEAEECFRPAIALGQEMGLAPRELVRLYFWLGEALCYKEGADGSRWDERIRVALEGLALLGADTESVEVALMNSLIEDKSEYREHGDRNAQFIQRLPYSEELRVPYIHIADRYIREGRLEEAEAWLQDVARKAEQHHDLRALGEVYTRTGRLLSARGDFRGAIHQHDRAVDLFTKIGDRSRRYECVWWLVAALFDIRGTEEAAVSARELVEAAGGMELLTKMEDHQRRFSCVELLVAALSDLGGTENAEASVRELLEAAEGAVDEGELASRLHRLGQGCLGRGDFNAARAFCRRAIEIAEGAGNRVDVVAWSSIVMGVVALCERSWDTAIQAFGDALQLFRETDDAWGEFWATLDLGRTSLVQGERAEAVRQFQEAMRLWRPEFAGQVRDHPSRRLGALAGLQEAYEDLEEFRAFCHQFQQEDPEYGGASFVQWSLEPTQPQYFPQTLSRDDFRTSLSSDWVRAPSPRPRAAPAARWRGWCWYEPVRSNSFQIGTCSVQIHNGLEIQAANRRDLNLGNPWHRKSSAPQLRRSVSGDFALQTVCVPVSGEQPAIGGIFLWRNEWNFLRLDRGTGGEHEVSFTGCLQQEEVVIGRGRLASERVFLRLERLGGRVNALCSGDGESWFTVGHAEFSVEDPVEVGLHASGRIDRTLYPGAYPEGTAIRFEAFQGWCCG